MPSQPPEPEWVKTMTNVPLYVGMIANSWARLEHAMVPLANKLLRTADDKVGKIVMFALNPPAKRDLLLTLTGLSPLTERQKAEIIAFCSEFERLRKLRNDIIHGRWDRLSASGAPILHTSSARGKLKERFEEKEVVWLIKTQTEIEALVVTAFGLNDALIGLWPSTGTPQKPRRPR